MSDKLLKVGGINYEKVAKPLVLGSFGEVKTTQYPNTSFFMGSVNEPTQDNHVGSYGVFGVEVIATDYRGVNYSQRYDNQLYARNGSIYYLSTKDILGDFYLNFRSLVSNKESSVKLAAPVPSGNFMCTIIGLGNNIAVIGREGKGQLFNASTLEFISNVEWDTLAYVKNGNSLTSNPNNFYNIQVRDAGNTYVLSAHRISKYSDDAVKVSSTEISTILGDATAYLNGIRNFAATKEHFFVSATIAGATTTANNGSCIIVIKRSDMSLVKLLQDGKGIPRTLTPIAIASNNFGMHTIERSTGDVYRWTIIGNEVTYELSPRFTLNDFATTSPLFVVSEGSHVAVRTTSALYLLDMGTMSLVWAVAADAVGGNGEVWFDGLGHVCFADKNQNVIVVNKFLQVQGYGVKG